MLAICSPPSVCVCVYHVTVASLLCWSIPKMETRQCHACTHKFYFSNDSIFSIPILVCVEIFSCAQEPGTPLEIKAYAAGYGVEFDIFAKIDVNGSHAHPLYKFLKSRVSGGIGNFVKWNYEKVRSCDNHMTSLCIT